MSVNKRHIDHHPEPHSHHEHPDANQRTVAFSRLKWTLWLGLLLIAFEGLGSYWSHSLALLADAFHVLADVAGVGVTLLASYLAQRPQSPKRSYGYYRLEVLAALFNGLLLVGMSIYIFIEAYERFQNPHPVEGSLMFGVAVAGLIANLIMLFLLKPNHNHNINIRAAYLHILGDTISSLAVVITAVIIATLGLAWIDPLVSVLVAILICGMSVRLIWDSCHVLLEGTPRHMDPIEIERDLKTSLPHIVSIHDFHIWEITSHLFAMTAHVEARVTTLEDSRILIDQMNAIIQKKYGIGHTTFQVEPAR